MDDDIINNVVDPNLTPNEIVKKSFVIVMNPKFFPSDRSLRQFAKDSGSAISDMWHYSMGKQNPRIESIWRMAQAKGLTWDQFLHLRLGDIFMLKKR